MTRARALADGLSDANIATRVRVLQAMQRAGRESCDRWCDRPFRTQQPTIDALLDDGLIEGRIRDAKLRVTPERFAWLRGLKPYQRGEAAK